MKRTPTEILLLGISAKVSNRQDCRNQEFYVEISEGGISIKPPVQVFPDTYHRKCEDKRSIIEHVRSLKFPSTDTTCELLPQLICGTYKYEMSFDGKQRRWRRIK